MYTPSCLSFTKAFHKTKEDAQCYTSNEVNPNLFSIISAVQWHTGNLYNCKWISNDYSYFAEKNFLTKQIQMQTPNALSLTSPKQRHEAFMQCLLSTWKNNLLRLNLGVHQSQCHWTKQTCRRRYHKNISNFSSRKISIYKATYSFLLI